MLTFGSIVCMEGACGMFSNCPCFDAPATGKRVPENWCPFTLRGSKGCLPCRISVPEGQPTIARRFNAGYGFELQQVPQGRLTDSTSIPQISIASHFAMFQPSLRDSKSPEPFPGVETPGYSRKVPSGLPGVAGNKFADPSQQHNGQTPPPPLC